MQSVTVEHHSWQQWDTVAGDWERLAECSSDASVYVAREWVEAWLAVYGDALQPEIVTFHGAGRTVGACLLVSRRQWVKGVPLRRLYLNCAGEDEADSPFIEHNVLVAEAGFEAAVSEAFIRHAGARRWDELCLDGMAAEDPTIAAATGLGELEPETRMCPYADLTALRGRDAEDSLLAIPKKTRHQIRRTIKYYQEVQGACPTLELARTTDQALAFLDELAELHGIVWQGRGKAGAFASARFARFHRTFIANAFRQGLVALLRTRVGEETIGVLYAFLFRGRVYAYQTGFHYATDNRPSPGLLTHYLAIDHFLRNTDAIEYDFGAGDAEYKHALSTSSRPLRWAVVRRRTAAELAFLGARALKRQYESWVGCAERSIPVNEA